MKILIIFLSTQIKDNTMSLLLKSNIYFANSRQSNYVLQCLTCTAIQKMSE